MGWEFLLTSLVVVASPGTGVVITLAAALSHGRRAAVVAAFGCTLGILPHMLAAITGLAALLHASALAFELVRWAGIAYLLWMAWSSLRADGSLAIRADAAPRRDREVILAAILANLLNPKLSIFFVAFLPQFVAREEARPVAAMLALSGVFMAMTFAVFAGYGIFAAAARRHVLSRPAVLTWLRRSFAAAFLALGGRLALSER
jgi:threonine/homoserine/homoserine lactone efflux protein